MSFFPLSVFIACALALPLTAAPVTPGNVAARVREANPELAAARLRIREAGGRSRQAGRLANPELELSFRHDPRFRAGELEVGFAQRFPLTNRLKLERRASAVLVRAAEAEVAEVERGLVRDARERVVELLLLRQRRALLKERVRLAGELSDHLKGAVDRGEASALDAGEARLNAASTALELQSLALRETALLGELKPLVGTAPGESLIVSGELPAPRLPKRGNATPDARPDYQAARLQAAAARESRAVEQARRVEDMQAGLFTTLERTPEQDNDGFIGFRLSLPLPLWNRNEGAIEEAVARQERSEREADALGLRIRQEAAAAYAAMKQSLAALRQLDDDLLPLAAEQERAAREAWSAGQLDVPALVRVSTAYQQIASARLDALREFHLARLRYEVALH